MIKKKGISAVVATVLIILIVVVGVGIIWGVILPLFAELDYLSYSDVRLNIVLQGYTIYYPDAHFAFVQIERGQDEINMTELEIGFNFDGTTKTYRTLVAPTPGGKHTYKFNFTKDGIPLDMIPKKVTVAPVFVLNNKIKLGSILDEVDMPVGTVYLSGDEWRRANDGANNILKGTLYYYYDSDGDDYGNDLIFQRFEEGQQEENYVLIGGDCDDGVNGVEINPGADEIMNNGVDEDCDGLLGLDECRYLNVQGGSYILENDVTVISSSCFLIEADSITLNLGGYTVEGIGGNEFGVYIRNRDDVRVLNGAMKNFFIGVYIPSGSDNYVGNLLLDGNQAGIYVGGASGTVIEGVNVVSTWGNYAGIFIGANVLRENSYNIIRDSVVSNNLVSGIIISGNSKYNEIINVSAEFNSGPGIEIDVSAGINNNKVIGGRFCDSGIDWGEDVECSSAQVFEGLTECGSSSVECGLTCVPC